MSRFLATLSVLALFLGAAIPVHAETSIGARIGRKALRGFENITLGAFSAP